MDAGPKYLHSNPDRPRARAGHLMFIALDKLQNQGLEQAIIVVPEKSIGASFHAAKAVAIGVARFCVTYRPHSPSNRGVRF